MEFESGIARPGSSPATWTWSGEVSMNSLAIDPTGNLLVAGSFRGTVDFDPIPSRATALTSVKCAATNDGCTGSSSDAFVLKLQPNGAFVWADAWDSGGDDLVFDTAGDNRGDLYTTGLFEGKVDFALSRRLRVGGCGRRKRRH